MTSFVVEGKLQLTEIKCFDTFASRVCSMQILQGCAFSFIKTLKCREKKSGGQFLLVEKHNTGLRSKFVNIKNMLQIDFYVLFFFNKIAIAL